MSSTNAASIRKPYPSDVSDEEWAFVAPYLALVRGDAPQRRHDLREAFNAARWVVHTGAPWRWLPHDLPPWDIVHAQTRRWLAAGVFEALVADLRLLLRVVAGRNGQPSAAILDSRTLQSTPESGAAGRAGDSPQRPSSTWSPCPFWSNRLSRRLSWRGQRNRQERRSTNPACPVGRGWPERHARCAPRFLLRPSA
jgi:transposase